MAHWGWALAAALLAAWCGTGAAQERVALSSYFDNGPGQAATVLDGYVLRPGSEGRHPALVLLHGCGGLISASTHAPMSRDMAWAREFQARGYAVLLVDSFGPRRHGQMCAPATFDAALRRKRTNDAYGALWYLQSQNFVDGARIGIVGWSEGGGVVLSVADKADPVRPALPQGDFRAAVAFYPAGCRPAARPGWSSAIPLLVLNGGADVWTPAGPCKEVMDAAHVEMQVYPGAYHDFDWPGLAVRELPQYRTRAGVVPIAGTDPASRADAMARVPVFLARYLDGS